ncbi:hypothetical protein BU15DRAFT_63720 [Melanogaster broomeanus]|nr:hypothetical protein BU15DRAFT_63720 [Melanogaster broomeanus]
MSIFKYYTHAYPHYIPSLGVWVMGIRRADPYPYPHDTHTYDSGGFKSSAKLVVKAWNHKLVEDLTEDFGFCYKSLGDPADNVSHKGLYEHKIIQKAINISFYKDKRDKVSSGWKGTHLDSD